MPSFPNATASRAAVALVFGCGVLSIVLALRSRRESLKFGRRRKSGDEDFDRAPGAALHTTHQKRVPRVVSTGGRELAIEDIVIIETSDDYLVFDKPYDCRLDGESEQATVEKAARFADPSLEKIRFCNQLDYATSGIMVLARSKAFAREASRCFESRTSLKHYLAIGHGHCMRQGAFVLSGDIAVVEGDFRMALVNAPPAGGYGHHGGPASTVAICLGRGYFDAGDRQLPASAFLLRPLTGRRHQLRLHLAAVAGHPIVGDATYSAIDEEDRCVERMMLHAWRLELPLKTRTLSFVTPEPFAGYLPGDWPQKLPQALELVSLLADSLHTS